MSDEQKLPPVIIIDNGSGYLKAGLSNQNEPQVLIPALVGRQLLRYGEKVQTNIENKDAPQYKEIMLGDEVIPFRSVLELTHPIENGIIKDDEDLYRLWDYAITKKLGIEDPSDKKVIVTEAPMNPLENKIKICEVLFEKIGVEAVNIEPQAKCSLFCEGKDSGVVLDSGDGVTHCIPISNGIILRHNIERLDIAGRDITKYLIRLLQKKGYALNSSADFELANEIKEKFCFVSNDIASDRELDRHTSFYNSYYLLPDGSRIFLSNEKYEAPEILFDPYLIGKDLDNVPQMMFKSITNCPIDTRQQLFSSMILSGATTLFPGFPTRLENEMKKLYKENYLKEAEDKNIKIKINVLDSPRRKFSVFLGAGIIAEYYNTTESGDYWMSKDEWLECEDTGEKTKEKLLKEKCQNYFKDTVKNPQ